MSTKSQIQQFVQDLQGSKAGATSGPATKNMRDFAAVLLARAKKEKDADNEILDAINLDVQMLSNGELAVLMSQAAEALPDPPIFIA